MKLALATGLMAVIVVMGVGLYVTDFTAYLGNNPSTCNNRHVMDAVYEGWYHSGHKIWANCIDCHTPHASNPKYNESSISFHLSLVPIIFMNPDIFNGCYFLVAVCYLCYSLQ